MAANTDTGSLLYWAMGRSSATLYKNDGGSLLFWEMGGLDERFGTFGVGIQSFACGCFLFAIAGGQPYILRVQGIPGMRTFSQLGHGGL